jgi:hypothetical protein
MLQVLTKPYLQQPRFGELCSQVTLMKPHLSVQKVLGVLRAHWPPLVLVPPRVRLRLRAGDGAAESALQAAQGLSSCASSCILGPSALISSSSTAETPLPCPDFLANSIRGGVEAEQDDRFMLLGIGVFTSVHSYAPSLLQIDTVRSTILRSQAVLECAQDTVPMCSPQARQQ